METAEPERREASSVSLALFSGSIVPGGKGTACGKRKGNPMPAFDVGFKIVARDAGRRLPEVAGLAVDHWWPLVSEVQTTERFADRAFWARRGTHTFIVYLEAYTYWKREAPWNLLAKSRLLSERERLPTVCLVFVLRPRRYRPLNGRFELTTLDETVQFLRVREVCLWELEPQPWWEEVPGLMALYPLCRHGRPPREAVTHAAEAIKVGASDTVRRADLLTTLAIFGKLAYRGLDAASLIGREQMKESPMYEEIKDEGRVEIRQADILEALATRFDRETAARFADAVRRVAKLDKLGRLHRLAIRCDTAKDFQKGLRGR
jgi:hypothetical protein